MIPILNVSRDDLIVKLFKKTKDNSIYEYSTEFIMFKASIAGTNEKKSYRITKGVNSVSDDLMLSCANLPSIIEIDDKIEVMGDIYTVKSIGYYINETRLKNKMIFNPKYIQDRCRKGITVG